MLKQNLIRRVAPAKTKLAAIEHSSRVALINNLCVVETWLPAEQRARE
jgi:hypothetical protein